MITVTKIVENPECRPRKHAATVCRGHLMVIKPALPPAAAVLIEVATSFNSQLGTV